MSIHPFTVVALCAATLVPKSTAQAPDGGAARGTTTPAAPPTIQTEDELGLSFFRPQHTNARELIEYAKELTEPLIEYSFKDGGGGTKLRRRDRFVRIDESIGVQGDEASIQRGLEFLSEIDRYVGASRAGAPAQAVEEPLTRTVRLRSMSVGAAVQLLDAMAQRVERHVVVDSATIILRGAVADVARAETLLREVDLPSAQMTLSVSLLEASDDAATPAVAGELGKTLGALLPGKPFREVGRFMLRGGVSGSSPLELSTGFGDSHPEAPQARFLLHALSRSWDAERGVLTLGQCQLKSERPRFTTQQASEAQSGVIAAPTRVFTGMQEEGLTTDLTLKQGQETVVGALGATSLLVVLRFTVD